jgi:HSP20 family molecular chaperone IbpA
MTTENSTLDVEKQEAEVVEGTERTRAGKVYVPRADIIENEDAIVVVADMPGVDENSIDITLEKRVLSINGYVSPATPENFSLTYAEYGIGHFERKFTLSDEIDQDHIEATVKDGVLRLTLPKAGPAKTRRIEVRSA